MLKDNIDRQPRTVSTLIHVIGWGIAFGFPFLMTSRSGFTINWKDYFGHICVMPMSLLIVFYANYFLLIPRYLFKDRIQQYLMLNLVLIALVVGIGQIWQEYFFFSHPVRDFGPNRRPMGPPRWTFVLRDACSLALIAGLSAAIRFSTRWAQIEAARREAEQSRTEAELKNLRNQLNPHFLLNTLNNIYALIAFDAEKAQNAVQELSRLLRHVLYDNQQNYVPLNKEMDFIRNYIELMRIRMPQHVKVDTDIDISPGSRTPIAPLIFISLIENAFKHGISPTETSFIRIRFSENTQAIRCEITNSCHPKTQADKSGSGIGLEQVKRRLELTYPGHYRWQYGPNADGSIYQSLLIIDKTIEA